MQTTAQTSKDYFNSLTTLFAAMLGGQVMLAAVAYFLNADGSFSEETKGFDDLFQLLVPLFVIGGLAGSVLLYRNRIQAIRTKKELTDKMRDYRAALIIKYALLEGPSIVGLIAYLLTGNLFYLGLSAILMLAFFLYKPSRDRAANDLELSPSERASLDDPGAVIT